MSTATCSSSEGPWLENLVLDGPDRVSGTGLAARENLTAGTAPAGASERCCLTRGPADDDSYALASMPSATGPRDGSLLVLRAGAEAAETSTEAASRPIMAARAGYDGSVTYRTAIALPARWPQAGRARVALQAVREQVRSTPPDSLSLGKPTAHKIRSGGAHRRSIRGACEIWSRTGYERELDKRIAAPRAARSITIAVLSPRRASGSTTITAMLGSLLAVVRRVRVLAVTSDPHLASLAPQPGVADSAYPHALLAASDARTTLSTQVGRTSGGLMIAAMPAEGGTATDLDSGGYRTLFAQLRDSVGALLLDCRGRLDAPATRAALESAHQLVLVTDNTPNSVDLVSEAATWLERHAPPLVLVVNKTGGGREAVGSLQCNLPFARGRVNVPYDRSGAQRLLSDQFSLAAAPKNWRTPIRELGALVTADWPRLGLAA